MEKRFKVEVPNAARPPFPRLITRQTETDEAERHRWRGETAVKIERDYTDRQRENKEQEVQYQSERERERPRVEPDSAVRGTCSRCKDKNIFPTSSFQDICNKLKISDYFDIKEFSGNYPETNQNQQHCL
ncbi:hypothetical protein PAMP_021390 [Pampus punctatissimus]